MTEIRASRNELHLDETSVSFGHEIKDYVVIGGTVVVLLKTPAGESNKRNILAVGSDGERIWEVEPTADGRHTESRYTEIRLQDGKLVAYNWNGGEYVVDIDTGEVHPHRLSK